jgi:hypothetical protein
MCRIAKKNQGPKDFLQVCFACDCAKVVFALLALKQTTNRSTPCRPPTFAAPRKAITLLPASDRSLLLAYRLLRL